MTAQHASYVFNRQDEVVRCRLSRSAMTNFATSCSVTKKIRPLDRSPSSQIEVSVQTSLLRAEGFSKERSGSRHTRHRLVFSGGVR